MYLPNTERVGETSGDGGGPLPPSRARTFFRGGFNSIMFYEVDEYLYLSEAHNVHILQRGFSWMLSFISLCFHKNRKLLTLIRCNEEERRER